MVSDCPFFPYLASHLCRPHLTQAPEGGSVTSGECQPAVEPIKAAGQSPGANDLEEVRGDRQLRYASLQRTRIAK